MAGQKRSKAAGGKTRAKRPRADPFQADLEAVQTHADAICADRKHSNQLLALLALAQHEHGPVVLGALQGLQRVWLQWLEDGTFSFHDATPAKFDSPLAALATWTRTQYVKFIQVLLETLALEDSTLQATALHVLMSLVKRGPGQALDAALCYHVVRHMVNSPGFQPALVRVFVKEYLTKYQDVAVASLQALKQIAKHHSKQAPQAAQFTADELFAAPRMLGSKELVHNAVTLMLALPPVDSALPLLAQEPQQAAKPLSLKAAGNSCWLQVLQLELPAGLYLTVLKGMHLRVLPWLSSPLRLSDFLTRSYNVGGLTSVLALSGLFELMTAHNLEYPAFYQKLYEQLVPQVLEVPYKTRFWQLINLCLVGSPKLPAYLVAGFAKKLARLALSSSPSGAMAALAVVFNMLKKHPSLRPLVHREALGEAAYDFGEPLLDKCNALEDSLWELTALKEHYCPEVAAVAKGFQKDFEAKNLKGLEPEEFVDQSYQALIEDEMDRKLRKEVPLGFKKPAALFGEAFAQVWA